MGLSCSGGSILFVSQFGLRPHFLFWAVVRLTTGARSGTSSPLLEFRATTPYRHVFNGFALGLRYSLDRAG